MTFNPDTPEGWAANKAANDNARECRRMRVRNAITESAANGYTIAAIAREHGLSEIQVLQYLDSAARGFNTPRDEVEALRSRIDSKPLGRGGKVIPHPTAKDRLGGRTEASPGKLARGWFYEDELNRCRVCDKPILPTGKRGRPRVKHKECE